MIMKGVLMPVVSAGSNHAGASEACTPHVIRPSGAAAAASGALRSTDASANIKSQRGRAVIEAPFANVSLPCVADEPGRRDPGQGARLVLVRHVSGDPNGADRGAAGVADQHAARRRDDPSLRHGVERREKACCWGCSATRRASRGGAQPRDALPLALQPPAMRRALYAISPWSFWSTRSPRGTSSLSSHGWRRPASGRLAFAVLQPRQRHTRQRPAGPADRRPDARATDHAEGHPASRSIAALGDRYLGYRYIDPRGPRRARIDFLRARTAAITAPAETLTTPDFRA